MLGLFAIWVSIKKSKKKDRYTRSPSTHHERISKEVYIKSKASSKQMLPEEKNLVEKLL